MNALQAGITAAREGHQAEAQALLRQALQADPRSEQGWLWMSTVVETDAKRRTCLERVLAINPLNQTARAGLDKLSSADSSGEASESYLPVSQSEPRQAQTSTGSVARPSSPHSMPTVAMDPVVPDSRPIRRLAPEPLDELAQLRAAQFQPASSPDSDPSSTQSDPFMALVLIGGLSITAIAGALMLGVLWLIGWPP